MDYWIMWLVVVLLIGAMFKVKSKLFRLIFFFAACFILWVYKDEIFQHFNSFISSNASNHYLQRLQELCKRGWQQMMDLIHNYF